MADLQVRRADVVQYGVGPAVLIAYMRQYSGGLGFCQHNEEIAENLGVSARTLYNWFTVLKGQNAIEHTHWSIGRGLRRGPRIFVVHSE